MLAPPEHSNYSVLCVCVYCQSISVYWLWQCRVHTRFCQPYNAVPTVCSQAITMFASEIIFSHFAHHRVPVFSCQPIHYPDSSLPPPAALMYSICLGSIFKLLPFINLLHLYCCQHYVRHLQQRPYSIVIIIITFAKNTNANRWSTNTCYYEKFLCEAWFQAIIGCFH